MNQLSIPSTVAQQMEMLIQSAQSIMRLEQVQSQQNAQLAELSARIDSMIGDTEYLTVWQFVKNEGIKKKLKEIVAFDLKCQELCHELDITMGRIPDIRFGSVHSYPVEVLREVLEGTK